MHRKSNFETYPCIPLPLQRDQTIFSNFEFASALGERVSVRSAHILKNIKMFTLFNKIVLQKQFYIFYIVFRDIYLCLHLAKNFGSVIF